MLGRDPAELNRLSDEVGAVLDGVTFIFFGAVILGPALAELTWKLALYAVLSLTLARMLPVAVAVYITVGLSVLAHGLTAAPLADRYARWYERRTPAMETTVAEVRRPRGPQWHHPE